MGEDWRLGLRGEEKPTRLLVGLQDNCNKLETSGILQPGGPSLPEFICWIQICTGASKRHTTNLLCLAVFGRWSATWRRGTSSSTGPVFSSRDLKHLPDYRPEGWRTQLNTAREYINSLSLLGWRDGIKTCQALSQKLERFLPETFETRSRSIKTKIQLHPNSLSS